MLHPSIRRKPMGVRLLLSCLTAVALSASIAAGSASAATPSITVSATSTAVTLSGTLSAGAVNVIANSTGKLKEPSIVLIRLLPGATEAEALTALKDPKLDPNAVSKFGSIVFDEEAPEGKGDEAETLLAAGNYLAVLVGETGPTTVHAAFTVAASVTPLALPAAAAQEKTVDFGFKGPSTLKVGELVGWEDAGYVVHMNLGFPVKNKKDAAKVIAGLKSGHEKSLQKLIAGPPVLFQGPVSPGGYQQSVVTARPGLYVQVCFMATQDGRPHTRLGMERLIKITK